MMKKLGIAISIFAFLVAGIYGCHRYRYPYGYSHCCLKGLGLALLQYAEKHDGHFPAGAGSPEASLSLLSREDYGVGAEILRGKTVPVEKVSSLLEQGELLGPDSCGWHYVEGLTLSDDPELAIVWDKVRLGHNGADLHGGHSVWLVRPEEQMVPASEWPQFLERQEQLMAARTEAAKKGLPAITAKIRLPSGEIVDHYDAPYLLHESYTTPSGGGSRSSSGSKLDASVLRWERLIPPDDQTIILILSFNGWQSKPVQIRVLRGEASPNSAVFEMQTQDKEQPQSPATRDQLR